MKQEIKEKLKQISDEKYKEFHSSLCPGTQNIIGVRVPILRNYAKELIQKYPIEEILNNIDNEYYEEIMLQGMLIGLSKNGIEETIPLIEKFIPKIDNWAVCDTFCAGLKITKKYPKEMWKFIQKYLKSNEEFKIRFAVVMILDYYIDEEHIDQDLEIFNDIKNNEYYVQMAIAWAISICLIKFYDKTIKFLNNRIECKLDNFTYNKSIQKAIESYRITKEQKEFLRKMKI